MKKKCVLLFSSFFLLIYITGFAQKKKKDCNIVLLVAPKSHGPGEHEHVKNAELIKTMLENANVKGLHVSVFNIWPEDPAVLDKADLIMTLSDGRDGEAETLPQVPFMTDERMKVMEKQMKRGCGFITFHFSTFAPDRYGSRVINWGGGYFDWQDDQGKRNWYSAIKIIQADVKLTAKGHPITNGVKPFHIEEEFYYNIRFGENDQRLTPIADVPELKGNAGNGNTVAWAVQRTDGGRGFCTTMGHYYKNWQNKYFRRLMLNGIVWAAGKKVPAGGVKASFPEDI